MNKVYIRDLLRINQSSPHLWLFYLVLNVCWNLSRNFFRKELHDIRLFKDIPITIHTRTWKHPFGVVFISNWWLMWFTFSFTFWHSYEIFSRYIRRIGINIKIDEINCNSRYYTSFGYMSFVDIGNLLLHFLI